MADIQGTIQAVTDKVQTWMQIIKSLPFDGGPSVTRWVFLRTSEVVSLGWLALVIAEVYRYIKFGTADTIHCGVILTLGGGLFAFAQNAQVKKLSLDPKSDSNQGSAS